MMDSAIIGYTGFVGSNIIKQQDFKYMYNTSNIETLKHHDFVVYTGVRAEKFLANKYGDKDKTHIDTAIENIKKLSPKKLILISTIDVYKNPNNVDEDSLINKTDLQPYGLNRLILEEWVQTNIDDYHILRLPGLFGENLKKNFIYDMITVVPSMLTKVKYEELIKKNKQISEVYYEDGDFYKLNNSDSTEYKQIQEFFRNNDFNSLSFTDCNSVYQYYNLNNIWKDISYAIENNIKLLNVATEPIASKELYDYIFKQEFNNKITDNPAIYNMKTKYSSSGYLYSKDTLLSEIKDFVMKRI